MAFNPFDVFRRNQKILFACLTIVVMFMFVLSFGRGDFFEWLPRWLGSKKRHGDPVAVVDGSKVYPSELEDLRRRRTLANLYMTGAGERATIQLSKYVSDGLSRVSAENKEAFERLLAARRNGYVGQDVQMKVMMAQYGAGAGPTATDYLVSQERTVGGVQTQLYQIADKGKEADKEVAKAAQTLVDLDLRLISGGRGEYFSNLPTGGYRDLLEFSLWLKKADKLGVTFTDADVAGLARQEFDDRLSPDDWKEVEAGLRTRAAYSPDLVRAALADEFKVRAAQAAVLGRTSLRPLGREYDAPYDYYQFYKDQTSPGRYAMISVPADNYLDKVTGQPTETELRDIFRNHKNDEPNPGLARPGLKEPRRVKVDWLEARGDEPYFQVAAAEALTKAGALAKVSGFLAAPLGGAASAGLLGAAAPLSVPDVVLAQKYAEYRTEHDKAVRENWYATPAFAAPRLLDAAFLRPAGMASLAGLAAGASATGAGALATPGAVVGEAVLADRRARVDTLPAALIAPANPGLGLPAALLATAAVQNVATRPLPLEAVRGQLVEKAKEDTARQIANGDLKKLLEELTKLKVTSPDSEEAKKARALVDDFTSRRGLRRGGSTEPRDLYRLIDDPGLAALRAKAVEASGRLHALAGVRYVDPAEFGSRFLFEPDPANPRRAQPGTGLYKPQPYPQTSLDTFQGPLPGRQDPVFLTWRTADQEARAPRTFEEPGVKEKAAAAWRQAKARELARKAAEELAAKCGNLGSNFIEIGQKLEDVTRQFAAQFPDGPARDRVRKFELANVAPLVANEGGPAMFAGRDQVGPYNLAASAYLPYPTPKLEQELLRNKDKPLSTAFVAADRPGDAQYVAVLIERTERSPDLFGSTVYGPFAGFGDLAPVVSRQHQDELHKEAHDRAVALLKAEFRVDKENTAELDKKSDAGE